MQDKFEIEDRWTGRERKREFRRMMRTARCGGSPARRLFFAVFLIVAGVALFLDNLGVLRLRDIWAYSPLLMVAWGVSVVWGGGSLTRRYLGILLIAFGALGTLLNLGVLRLHTRGDSWPLALLLIAFGVLALIKTIEESAPPKPSMGFPQQSQPPYDNVLNEHTFAGSIKRRVETANFLGGQIDCVFGSVELDLRYAQVALNGGPVTINVQCVFGTTKLRVPETWKITVQAEGVFGSVEDKTIPPRTTDGLKTPDVSITGQAVFSSVEVEN